MGGANTSSHSGGHLTTWWKILLYKRIVLLFMKAFGLEATYVHKSESTPTLISKGSGFRLVHWNCTSTYDRTIGSGTSTSAVCTQRPAVGLPRGFPVAFSVRVRVLYSTSTLPVHKFELPHQHGRSRESSSWE